MRYVLVWSLRLLAFADSGLLPAAGQVAVGWLSDQMDASIIIAGLGVCSAVTSLTAWGFANTLPQVYGFVILYGAFSGICSVWSAVGRDVAGK